MPSAIGACEVFECDHLGLDSRARPSTAPVPFGDNFPALAPPAGTQ